MSRGGCAAGRGFRQGCFGATDFDTSQSKGLSQFGEGRLSTRSPCSQPWASGKMKGRLIPQIREGQIPLKLRFASQ